MKTIMVIALVALIVIVTSVRANPPKKDMDHFFHAVQMTETGCRANPPAGDNGKSIGPMQIGRLYFVDSGVGGDYQRCHNLAFSKEVMIGYWQRFCPKALAAGDWETLARVHNGGPAGARHAATIKYWNKVKKYL
jgi:hypothetical protein